MARSKLGVQLGIVLLVLSGCNGDRRADQMIDTGTVTPPSSQGSDPAGTFNDTGQVTTNPVTPPPPPAPPPNDSGQVESSINLKAIRSAPNDSGQISADTRRKR